ncbi:hypothetical protein L9F63_020543, partial [Diploptera punctata]
MPIYLDYNATTPLEPTVIESITKSLSENWANPSSGYASGVAAKKIINEARKNIGLMIGANPEDIIFTSGGTEANNMVIFGILEYYANWLRTIKTEIKDKPHIITTNVEHDAVILPIRHLQKKRNVTIVPVLKTGCVDVQDIISEVRPTTCLITVMLANNETGVIMPIEHIGRSIQQINKQRRANKLIEILYHTDAAQAIGKIEVDTETLQANYITIVGHKFYGPRIGCLYAQGIGSKAPVYPMLFGGGQESGYRPGTENTPMIVGLGEAARLVFRHLTKYSSHMTKIRDYLETKLKETFGNEVVFNCKSDVIRLPNTCNISFRKEGLYGHRVLSRCTNISASIGAACHTNNQPSGSTPTHEEIWRIIYEGHTE